MGIVAGRDIWLARMSWVGGSGEAGWVIAKMGGYGDGAVDISTV